MKFQFTTIVNNLKRKTKVLNVLLNKKRKQMKLEEKKHRFIPTETEFSKEFGDLDSDDEYLEEIIDFQSNFKISDEELSDYTDTESNY